MTEDFLMEKQTIYEMEYVFNLKDFIDFMMIQYNVNAKIESDEISEKETRKWMQDTLRFIYRSLSGCVGYGKVFLLWYTP